MVKFQVPNSITFRDMNYYPVTDGQTDRKRWIWAHRAICTGGLKKPTTTKVWIFFNWYIPGYQSIVSGTHWMIWNSKSYPSWHIAWHIDGLVTGQVTFKSFLMYFRSRIINSNRGVGPCLEPCVRCNGDPNQKCTYFFWWRSPAKYWPLEAASNTRFSTIPVLCTIFWKI